MYRERGGVGRGEFVHLYLVKKGVSNVVEAQGKAKRGDRRCRKSSVGLC
jgi:hypothetical protein